MWHRLLVGALAAALTLTPTEVLLHKVNAVRETPLIQGARLSRYAERHAHRMAKAGYIFHSDLDVPGRWAIVGENVGVGSTVGSVFRAFMRSKPHRQNILRHRFDHIGIGVVRRDGSVWVVLVFGGKT
jgi:uncharacterized protein YkwD